MRSGHCWSTTAILWTTLTGTGRRPMVRWGRLVGGGSVGKNPTDRGKNGTKRSVLCDGKGGPLAVVIDGANVHDTKLLERTIDAVIVARPEPDEVEQHLCLDKGYDNPTGQMAAIAAHYMPHIRRIGEEKLDPARRRTQPARRWVVERLIAWLNGCRAILVRYAKKPENYLGMIKLACSLLWYRRAQQNGLLR